MTTLACGCQTESQDTRMARKSKIARQHAANKTARRQHTSQAAAHRRAKRLKQYDPTLVTTKHALSCGMFQSEACNCA
jgi:hypothetical protein